MLAKRNIPNLLTMFRVAASLVSLVLFSFNIGYWNEVIFVLFILGAISDYFDGYFARKYKLDTNFGICFDPIADKIFVLAFFLILIQTKTCSPILAFIILGRELFVSGLREFLSKDGISMPVSKLAKWKTGMQMTAIGIMTFRTSEVFASLFYKAKPLYLFFCTLPILGNLAMCIAALLTIITAMDYVLIFLRYKK